MGSVHEMRRQAEDVARYALWRAPSTRDGLITVLRWADWAREWNIEHPDRPEEAADRGIDLVATYSDGRRTAVQVKLRTGGAPVGVGWEELATFAAKSATEPFSDRLLVLLGDATLSGNARAELARQHALKSLTVWAATEIEAHVGTQWPADHDGLRPRSAWRRHRRSSLGSCAATSGTPSRTCTPPTPAGRTARNC